MYYAICKNDKVIEIATSHDEKNNAMAAYAGKLGYKNVWATAADKNAYAAFSNGKNLNAVYIGNKKHAFEIA